MNRETLDAFETAYHRAVAMAADARTSDARLAADDVAEAILVLLDKLAGE